MNAGEQRELKIEVSRADWTVNGKPAPELHGCLDIDLSASPSTNTLPLRRLQLQRGQSQPVTAAWVRFPSLEIGTLQQTYKRLDDTRYWYESATGFTAEIRVDAMFRRLRLSGRLDAGGAKSVVSTQLLAFSPRWSAASGREMVRSIALDILEGCRCSDNGSSKPHFSDY